VKWSDPAAVSLITAAGAVAVAVVGAAVNYLMKRQSKGADDATARKTEAETVAVEVKTARELLAEVKSYFSDRLTEQAADHKLEVESLNRKIDDLSRRVESVETQSRTIRQAWQIHDAWDKAAYEALRTSHPDYPPPPVVEGL
jgi:uncharacterized protein HemX